MDAFWKWPSVYDVLGVTGVVLSVFSVWFTWYLARKQSRADFRKTATELFDRVVQFVLSDDLSDSCRYLRDADRAIGNKEWDLAILRLDDAASSLARISANHKLIEGEQRIVLGHLANLRSLIGLIRQHQRSTKNRGHIPSAKLVALSGMYLELEQLRGRLATTHSDTERQGANHG